MAGKKITELTQANAVADTDLFIVETNEGTKAVPYSLMKPSSGSEIVDCAASHNNIYRGKDLTNVYTIDEICERISNGTFEDLYIGDYFDVTISTTYTQNEIVRCVLAGFDIYMNTGDTVFVQHHAVVVPKNCFIKNCSMGLSDSPNSSKNGFIGSKAWTTILPIYQNALQLVLNNHILMHRTYQTSSIIDDEDGSSKKFPTKAEWVDTYLSLLSEIQVNGYIVRSCIIEGNYYKDYNIYSDNIHLPLFALNPMMRICYKNSTIDGNGDNTGTGYFGYWLKNCYCGDFSVIDKMGVSSGNSPSNMYGVRPVFCIG